MDGYGHPLQKNYLAAQRNDVVCIGCIREFRLSWAEIPDRRQEDRLHDSTLWRSARIRVFSYCDRSLLYNREVPGDALQLEAMVGVHYSE